MQIWVSEENLPFFEALSSPVRIKILEHLAQGESNIKDLAEAVGVTSAMMTAHVNKLEAAGLILSTRTKKAGKVCSLVNQWYTLRLPTVHYHQIQNYEIQLGVGQYTKAEIQPTCGIANNEKIIGGHDDPKFFFDPERIHAQLVWFRDGFIEYEIPNYVPDGCEIIDIEISAEMCSEYPHIKNDWKSDINLYLNGHPICTWVSPGDFGDRRGKYTPGWWLSAQYGILKRFEINKQGVYLDKEIKSPLTLDAYDLSRDHWTLRFEVSSLNGRPGGLTIFGENFGDYARGIVIKVNYKRSSLNNNDNKNDLYNTSL